MRWYYRFLLSLPLTILGQAAAEDDIVWDVEDLEGGPHFVQITICTVNDCTRKTLCATGPLA